MQQQHIVGLALQEQFLDVRMDDVRSLVPHDLHGERADLRITEHSAQAVSVRRRGSQVPQTLLLVLVICHDQGSALARH